MLTEVSFKFTHCEWEFAIWRCVGNYPFIMQKGQSYVRPFCYGVKTFLDEHVDPIVFAGWGESNAHVYQGFQCSVVFCDKVGHGIFWVHLELLEICYRFVVIIN